jgi:hypothetical protein
MYFDKKRYIVPIQGGSGLMNTDKLRGMVVHLIVRPEYEESVWDLTLLDKEGDELFEVKDHCGRYDDKSGLPLGKDAQEKLTIQFTRVTGNKPIKVIFKTQEIT